MIYKKYCAHCNQPYTANRWKATKFCSRLCKDSHQIIHKAFACIYCGKMNNSRSTSRNKYCNRTCCGLHRKKLTMEAFILSDAKHKNPALLRQCIVTERGNICEECKIPGIYNSKPITLQVHHIDGISTNNKPENLKILCPNCHTQTDNFGSKNKVYRKTGITNPRSRWF